MASRKIAPELLDHQAWPTVDDHELTGKTRTRFLRLSKAVRAACDGIKSAEIKRRFRVSRSHLKYLLDRCTSRHSDGRLLGFRALVKDVVRKPYVRTADATPGPKGGGMAGAMQALLRDCPTTANWLRKRLKPAKGMKVQAAGLNRAEIHAEFLTRLRKEGRKPDQYPFKGSATHGYESFCALVRKLIANGDDAAAQALYGDSANDGRGRNSGANSLFAPYFTYERVAYDEWSLQAIGNAVIITEDDREIDVPTSRLYFCPTVDFKSTAFLGYSVSIPKRFGAYQLLAAVECAIKPPPRKPHRAFKDLQPLVDEGLPAAVLPQARGRRICALVVDNHLSHLANRVSQDLRDRTGMSVSFGKVHSWIERYVVEGLFAKLAAAVRKLPSTTGSGPEDPATNDPVGKAMSMRIRIEDLLALLDQVVCRHNAQRARVLMAGTPNEEIARDFAQGCRLDILPRYDDAFLSDPALTIEIEHPVVHGNRATGRTPYIQLDRVEYTNETLKKSWSLIGQRLTVHIRGDYRAVRAFREDGTEFGILKLSGRWNKTPHTRQTRKTINALIASEKMLGKLDDPVDYYNRMLAEDAMRQIKGKRRRKIPKEINQLVASLTVPAGAADDPTTVYKMDPPKVSRRPAVKPRNRKSFFEPGADE